jgi:predicted transposase YbfD/YdcC
MENKEQTHLDLLLRFEGITDPRIERHKLYSLNEVLFLTISAVISGCSGWEAIADFGKAKLAWLRQYLPYANGVPSDDTINRVIGLIDYRSFESFFISWVEGMVVSVGGKVINIDGKKLRASVDKALQNKPRAEGGRASVHLVEAWCSELQLCLGQYKTEDKSNEITAIPALLDLLEISGCTVTIDAMGCQKDIASKIVGKQADYILGLKDNQPALHSAVKELFETFVGPTQDDLQDNGGHGRIESRRCRTLPAALLPACLREEWEGLTTLVEIQSERLIVASGAYSSEERHYLGSKVQSSALYNHQVRAHWGIENKLHWSMDVTFGEDKSRKRVANSAQNFGLICRIALNLLKTRVEKPKVSLSRRMNWCALSDDYRQQTLRF